MANLLELQKTYEKSLENAEETLFLLKNKIDEDTEFPMEKIKYIHIEARRFMDELGEFNLNMDSLKNVLSEDVEKEVSKEDLKTIIGYCSDYYDKANDILDKTNKAINGKNDLYMQIAKSDDLDAKMKLVQDCINRDVPVEALEILSRDSRWEVRLGTIVHINTTKEILENVALNGNYVEQNFILDQIAKSDSNLSALDKNADSILDILSKEELPAISSKALDIIKQRASFEPKMYEVELSVTLKNGETRDEILEIKSNPTLSIEDIISKRLKWRTDVEEYNIKEIKETLLNNDESPLNSIMAQYEASKPSLIVAKNKKNYSNSLHESFKNLNDVENIKNVVPLSAKIRIEEDNYSEIFYITFDNSKYQTYKYSEFKKPKESISEYLLENNFETIPTKKEYLKVVKNAISSIKTNLFEPLLADSAYLTSANLFYNQPMTDWKKSEVNTVIKNIKNSVDDFRLLNDFLNIECDDDDCSDVVLHNLNCEISANNLRGVGHCIEQLESNFSRASKQLDSINSMLETTKGDDFDNVEIEQENENSKKTRKLR